VGVLTEEVQAAVGDIRLCFASTASRDGEPNVSPKGSLCILDCDHLAFADIASLRTIANLRVNPRIEISMIDQLSRRGFRFNGTVTILKSGVILNKVATEMWEHEGPEVPVHHVVQVHVLEAGEVLSPAYILNRDLNTEELKTVWLKRYGYERLEQQMGLCQA